MDDFESTVKISKQNNAIKETAVSIDLIEEDNTVSDSKWANLDVGSYSSKHASNHYLKHNPLNFKPNSSKIDKNSMDQYVSICDEKSLESVNRVKKRTKFKNCIETTANLAKEENAHNYNVKCKLFLGNF